MGIILDGRSLAKQRNQQLKSELPALPRPPGLAVVLVGEDPASQVYVGLKARVAHALGIYHQQVDLPASIAQQDLLDEISRLNDDSQVDGILVQLPLPGSLDRDAVLDHIAPDKDVDGIHPTNMGLLSQGRPRFVACTPAGILALLKAYDVPIAGARATVIGRSPIVGRPVSLLLDQAQATVTVCHSRTNDLEEEVSRADIVIAALGRPRAIPGHWIKPGAAVVDVGTHRQPDGTLCGDLCYEEAVDHAGWITPVPGGVGPMTIAMLMANTLDAARAHLGLTVTP